MEKAKRRPGTRRPRPRGTRQLAEAQAEARRPETAARDQFDAADKELTRLREEYRETKKEEELAAKDVDRLIGECRHAYLSLPDGYRAKVSPAVPADWLSTTWPTADEQRVLKKDAGDLDAARSQLRTAQADQSKFDKLKAEQSAAQSTLDQVKKRLPPGDPGRLARRGGRLKAEEEALAAKIRGTKKLLQENELEARAAQQGPGGGAEDASPMLDSQLDVEEATRTQHRDAIDRAGKLLPPNWRDAANRGRAGRTEQVEGRAGGADPKGDRGALPGAGADAGVDRGGEAGHRAGREGGGRIPRRGPPAGREA